MERYDAFLKVGEGSFGSVHKATDKETGEIVAVKVFHNTDEEVVRAAIREARFLSACNHCNITGLREAYRSGSGRIYLVLEFAEHVLSQQLKMHRRGLPGAAVRSIIFQLLQALKYLHDRNIMHRDCKPANILITSEGMVKLCDFGFARYVESGSKPPGHGHVEPLTSYVITRWYRPPEVLIGQPYSTAVDIWAVGCIFAEMVTGMPLFPGASHLDQLYITIRGLGGLSASQVAAVRANKRLSAAAAGNTGCKHTHHDDDLAGTVFDRLAPHMSRTMMQFLRACLEPDPNFRATADQLLALSYMKEGAWEAAGEPQPPPAPAPAPTQAAAPVVPAHVVHGVAAAPSSAPALQPSGGSGGSSLTHVQAGSGSGSGVFEDVQGGAGSSSSRAVEPSRKRGPGEGSNSMDTPMTMDTPGDGSTSPNDALLVSAPRSETVSERLPPMLEADAEGDEDATAGLMEVERSSAPAAAVQPRFSYRARVTIPQGMNRTPIAVAAALGSADEHQPPPAVPQPLARRVSYHAPTITPSLLQRSSNDGDTPLLMPRRSLTQKSKLGQSSSGQVPDYLAPEKRMSVGGSAQGVPRQVGLTSPQASNMSPSPPHQHHSPSPPHVMSPHPPKSQLANFQARLVRRCTSTSGAEYVPGAPNQGQPPQHSGYEDMVYEGHQGGLEMATQAEIDAAMAVHGNGRAGSPTKGSNRGGGSGSGLAATTAAAITKLSTVGQVTGIGSLGAVRIVTMERSCSMPGQAAALQAVPRCPAPPAGHLLPVRPNISGNMVYLRESQHSMDGAEPHRELGQMPGVMQAQMMALGHIRKGASPLHSGMLLQRMQVSPEGGLISAGPSSINSSNDSAAVQGVPVDPHAYHTYTNPAMIAAAIGSAGSASHASGPATGTSSPTRTSVPAPMLYSREGSTSGAGETVYIMAGAGPFSHSVSCSGAAPVPMGSAGPISAPGQSASVLSRFGRALSLMGSRTGARRSPSHRLSTSSLNLDMQ